MKLLKMVLEGYKPLLLNNIRSLTITPQSVYQIVLGTNGSGKSSVVREANPMPPTPSNYIKTGKKVTVWEHEGCEYELTTTFKSGGKHSFIKRIGDADEELNVGGTALVQKELVKQIFGFTSDLVDLLTDKVRFTTMSSSKRREWLTSLCDTDFTYALGVYNKLRSAARDTQGAYKHIGARITKETAELERIGDLTEVLKTADLIREELNILLQNKEHNPPDVNRVAAKLDPLFSNIEKACTHLVKLVHRFNNPGFKNRDSIKSALQTLQGDLKTKESLLKHYTDDLTELQDLENTLSKTGMDGVESLKARLGVITERLEQLTAVDDKFQEQSDARLLYTMSEEVIPPLTVLLGEIPDNSDYRFSREALRAAQEKRANKKKEIERVKNGIAHIEHKLELFKQQGQTECPECKHRWVPGFTPELEKKLLDEVEAGNRAIPTLEKELLEIENYIQESEDYAGLINQFKGYVNNYPRLKCLWDYLIENEIFYNNPRNWIPVLGEWLASVERWVEIQSLREEQEEIKHALEAATRAEGTQHITSRMKRLEGLVEGVTKEIVECKRRIDETRTLLTSVDQILELKSHCEKLVDELFHYRDQYLVAVRDRLITGLTVKHQNRLAEIQRQHTERETLVGIINGLETQKSQLEEDQKVYKLLVDALSPNDGLIAEQLTGFIKSFTDHLNSIIARVWTYELQVQPCGLESGELDYRFPLKVKGESDPVADIKDGSTGQCDIIDFAFKLIVISYLKMVDIPLYLDELGASFDEQHRINVMTFIKELMDTGQFSQVFLISHYASSHGTFQQVDTLVLDPNNIVVPNIYNEHVVMR
jgi:recombinational DNA repair ATPase RecF/uncharacterized Zn finger protein (UPF0148 family)